MTGQTVHCTKVLGREASGNCICPTVYPESCIFLEESVFSNQRPEWASLPNWYSSALGCSPVCSSCYVRGTGQDSKPNLSSGDHRGWILPSKFPLGCHGHLQCSRNPI